MALACEASTHLSSPISVAAAGPPAALHMGYGFLVASVKTMPRGVNGEASWCKVPAGALLQWAEARNLHHFPASCFRLGTGETGPGPLWKEGKSENLRSTWGSFPHKGPGERQRWDWAGPEHGGWHWQSQLLAKFPFTITAPLVSVPPGSPMQLCPQSWLSSHREMPVPHHPGANLTAALRSNFCFSTGYSPCRSLALFSPTHLPMDGRTILCRQGGDRLVRADLPRYLVPRAGGAMPHYPWACTAI